MTLLAESPSLIYAYLIDIANNEDATAKELIILATSIGIFWHTFVFITKPIVNHFTYDTPWLRRSIEREWERGMKQLYEDWGVKKNKEEVINEQMKEWPTQIVGSLQHFVGGAVCFPTLLGKGDPKWAISLACCGGLSQAGFDIIDIGRMLYTRFFTKDGALNFPNVVVLFILIHHCLSVLLVIPMVICYRTLRPFHWLVCELQIVGGLIVFGEYSKMLDITKKEDLRQFKIINFILLVVMVWTRLIHWVYLCYPVIHTWYTDEAWAFLAVGGLMTCLFSVFNAVACVIPMYQKWKKFLHKSADYESLPSDAPDTQRSKMLIDLQQASNALLLEESINQTMITEDRIRLFLDQFDERREDDKLERRHTMKTHRGGKMAMGSTRLMRGLSVPPHMWSNKDD